MEEEEGRKAVVEGVEGEQAQRAEVLRVVLVALGGESAEGLMMEAAEAEASVMVGVGVDLSEAAEAAVQTRAVEEQSQKAVS